MDSRHYCIKKGEEVNYKFPYVVKIYYEENGKLESIEMIEYDDLEYTNIGKIIQRMEDRLGTDKIKNILVQPDSPNLTTFGHVTSLTIH